MYIPVKSLTGDFIPVSLKSLGDSQLTLTYLTKGMIHIYTHIE